MKRTETKHKTKNRLLTTNIVLALILLVSANLVLGAAITVHSQHAIRTQINQRMLDIANTAADTLDGDIMGRLEKTDEGTPEYEESLQILRNFQSNIDLSYIYGIRREPDGSFTFTVDPADPDPGEFGEPIVTTPALIAASEGTPSVDREPYQDAWGRFYSAYSPIFDSQGKIVGIVGVDFDAEWYDEQLVEDIGIIVAIVAISLVLGLVLAYTIMRRSQQRFRKLESEVQSLSQGFDTLNRAMMKNSVDRLDHQPDSVQNDLLRTIAAGEHLAEISEDVEFTELGERLRSMQGVMQRYIAYLDGMTYRDELTGVGSKLAYKKTLKEIDEEISAQQAIFAVGFFDINDLQDANTQYGFEVGDKLLIGTADALMRVFGRSNVYRVASDEFIAILRGKNTADMEDYFEKFVAELDRFNEKKSCPVRLAVAKGSSVYYPDRDENYRNVFRIAEEAQERDKARYHQLKANT